MLPPATRTQDVPTPPIPPVAAQPPEAMKLRPDGGPRNGPEGAGGTAERAPASRRPVESPGAEPGAEVALAEEHERALGRGRLIDVLG